MFDKFRKLTQFSGFKPHGALDNQLELLQA